MTKTTAAILCLCTLVVGFIAGYVYNEHWRFRVAVTAGKAVAGTAKNFVENSCAEKPTQWRCKWLKKADSEKQ